MNSEEVWPINQQDKDGGREMGHVGACYSSVSGDNDECLHLNITDFLCCLLIYILSV